MAGTLQYSVSVPTYSSPLIAVCDGFVYVGNPFGSVALAGNQGSAPLRSDVLVSMCYLNLTVFLVDGTSITTLPLATEIITAYAATAGSAPTNCSLCCTWRGRFVLAGDSGNPQNFFMARVGVPTDWDYSQLDPAAAVAGNLSTSGQIGEPIMALIPYSDDYLMIGCTNSLWMIQGDPADGGSIVRVSDQMGIIGPNAWCVDPSGTIYFIARGGLYTVHPAWEQYKPPELLTGESYDQYFQQIINDTNYVAMTWDVDKKYLHILVTPTDKSAAGIHLIYDPRNGGLWPQQYPIDQQPTAVCRYQANVIQNKSSILFGGFDGYVRRWTDTELLDDGETISAYVVLGPIKATAGASILSACTIDSGETLASDSAANWNLDAVLNAGPDAFSVTEGTPHSTATISCPLDRRTKTFRQRFRSGWVALKLMNTVASKYFSFESAELEFLDGGRNRERR